MDRPMRAALYTRPAISTGSIDKPLAVLQQIAASRGWSVVATFAGEPTSASPARSLHPVLDEVLQAAALGEIDVVLVASIDHLGTSLPDVVQTFNQLRALGMDIVAREQNLDTTSPAGPAISAVFAALAGCEKALLQQRAKIGLDRARLNGTRLGRPSNMNPGVRAAIIALRERGISIRRIARQLRVGNATVCTVLQAATNHAHPEGSQTSRNGFRTPLKALEQPRNGTRSTKLDG